MGKGQGKAPRAETEAPIVINGWTVAAHPAFLAQLDALVAGVRKEGDPSSGKAKVLRWLVEAMFRDIPQDPGNERYRQGKTLGKYTSWFRDHYAGRFRLFYRFSSTEKIIVFGWVNDEDTLRTYGAKTDAYAVFAKMLEAGYPPNDWAAC